jgi:hypothetical protein
MPLGKQPLTGFLVASSRDYGNRPAKSAVLFLGVWKYNVLRSSGWRNE